MEHLAKYLESVGQKPAQFAEKLGVEPSTITRIIKGERKPSRDLAKRIADATGISVIDLLYPEDGLDISQPREGEAA